MVEVSEALGRVAGSTEAGRHWLQHLPELLRDLASEWRLTLGEPLAGGSASYVVAACTEDGKDAVLKLPLPPGIEGIGPFEVELDALLAGGPTYVDVLAHDRSRRAVLQERLGPPLAQEPLPVREKLQVIAAALAASWVPGAAVPSATTLAVKGVWLADYIVRAWEATGRPCTSRAVDTAVALAQERAARHDQATELLLHGDGHAFNTLRGRDGYRLIDPDPVRGEPAYDLAIALRELGPDDLGERPATVLRELAELVAVPHDVDPDAVWQWAFVERMSTGLLCAKLGHDDWAGPMLAVADVLAR